MRRCKGCIQYLPTRNIGCLGVLSSTLTPKCIKKQKDWPVNNNCESYERKTRRPNYGLALVLLCALTAWALVLRWLL